MQPTPHLAPRLSLTLILIFALGGIVRAQSHPLGAGRYNILDSSGHVSGTLDVSTTAPYTSGSWTTTIGGITNNGSYAWDSGRNTYHSFRNTEPPTPVADVWWDGASGVWRWREIITGQTGTLDFQG